MIFSQKYRGVRVAIFPVYSCMGLDSARDRIDRREGSNLIYIIIIYHIYLISFSKSMVCVCIYYLYCMYFYVYVSLQFSAYTISILLPLLLGLSFCGAKDRRGARRWRGCIVRLFSCEAKFSPQCSFGQRRRLMLKLLLGRQPFCRRQLTLLQTIDSIDDIPQCS